MEEYIAKKMILEIWVLEGIKSYTSSVSPELLHSSACSQLFRNLARKQVHSISKVNSPKKALN